MLGKRLGMKRLALPTLVDGSPTHIWKPLLHEVATGSLNTGKIKTQKISQNARNYPKIFITGEDELNYFSHGHATGYEFQFGWMNGLDPVKKVIKLGPIISDFDGRKIAGPREVPYDTLVLAVGAVSNSFGTPGVDEHCIKLDTPKDAEFLRKLILSKPANTT